MITGVRREGGLNSWGTEKFKGNKNTLYETTIMNTCHYTFVQTHKLYNKKEPQPKPWTLGDNDIWMEVHQLEHMHVVLITEESKQVRAGSIWEISILST